MQVPEVWCVGCVGVQQTDNGSTQGIQRDRQQNECTVVVTSKLQAQPTMMRYRTTKPNMVVSTADLWRKTTHRALILPHYF